MEENNMPSNTIKLGGHLVSIAGIRNMHKALPLVIAGLVIGCNSATTQAIKNCNIGSKNACEKIAENDWAKKQIATDIGRKMLQQVKNEIKYQKDIEWAKKCLSGQDSWCTDVNLKSLIIVDPLSTEKIRSKLVEIEAVKVEAERIKAEKASRGSWQYSTKEDMASGKKSSSASLKSENTLSFGFPYEGSQFAQLTIRRHPRYGFDVFISIQQGQILCNNYTNPYILVRFDDHELQQFECVEPADNSSTYSFIRNADQFERDLKRASVAYITLTFYQEGSQALKFKVKGYDSSKI
jgi:hypothetical protein